VDSHCFPPPLTLEAATRAGAGRKNDSPSPGNTAPSNTLLINNYIFYPTPKSIEWKRETQSKNPGPSSGRRRLGHSVARRERSISNLKRARKSRSNSSRRIDE